MKFLLQTMKWYPISEEKNLVLSVVKDNQSQWVRLTRENSSQNIRNVVFVSSFKK